MQVGCGVGNTVFPILEVNTHPDTRVYACDFSSTAVDLVKQHPDYVKHASTNGEEIGGRCNAFVCDITKPEDWESNAPFKENSLGKYVKDTNINAAVTICRLCGLILDIIMTHPLDSIIMLYFRRCYIIICHVCPGSRKWIDGIGCEIVV